MERNAKSWLTGRDPRRPLLLAALVGSLGCAARPQPGEPVTPASESYRAPGSYGDLVALFEDWRDFERPPLRNGAPDYTAQRMAAAHRELDVYRARLDAIHPETWPVDQQVDWQVVLAEMNGFDFNCRVLRPWVRDPAFYQSVWTYQSDVPAHEGPTNHALLELWTYEFPLTESEEARLVGDLQVIPPLLDQAKGNLTGNARDLFVAGIQNLRDQGRDLQGLRDRVGKDASARLQLALVAAQDATQAMVAWLEAEAPKRTGPSGIGKENYTWYLQHVHLVPMDLGGRSPAPDPGAGACLVVPAPGGSPQSAPPPAGGRRDPS